MRLIKCLLVLILLPAASSYSQEIELPSNPLKGRMVFEEKGCIDCHAISGFGGDTGPDLSRDHYYGSFLELASIIWNHIPQMDRKYRQKNMSRPNFNQSEMLNLIGFLYYLRYLGEPGSVANGKKLLESKNCMTCHGVAGKGGDLGPDFGQIQQFASPLYMVQAMWNHGPAMLEKIEELGIKIPELTGENIVDISAYIKQANLGNTEIFMSPGDPLKGKIIFTEKKCHICHAIAEGTDRIGSDLSEIAVDKSVTEIAGSMWNHSPIMAEYMKEEAIDMPLFEGKEMADLIAYLYFLGFEDKSGDPQQGEDVFIEKGCARCHEEGGDGVGTDLASLTRFGSPIRMIQLMWNHAPKMEDLLLIQNEEWPQLSTVEIQHLYAYLRKIIKDN